MERKVGGRRGGGRKGWKARGELAPVSKS